MIKPYIFRKSHPRMTGVDRLNADGRPLFPTGVTKADVVLGKFQT